MGVIRRSRIHAESAFVFVGSVRSEFDGRRKILNSSVKNIVHALLLHVFCCAVEGHLNEIAFQKFNISLFKGVIFFGACFVSASVSLVVYRRAREDAYLLNVRNPCINTGCGGDRLFPIFAFSCHFVVEANIFTVNIERLVCCVGAFKVASACEIFLGVVILATDRRQLNICVIAKGHLVKGGVISHIITLVGFSSFNILVIFLIVRVTFHADSERIVGVCLQTYRA